MIIEFVQLNFLLILICIFRPSQSQERYKNLYGTKEFTPKLFDPDLVKGGLEFISRKKELERNAQPNVTPKDKSTYDFIIVGGGSAGSVIASRLSEVTSATVLLIEAGREENYVMDIPLTSAGLQLDFSINWAYKTTRSGNSCLGLVDEQCNWPRGKVLGGTSVLNYMVATRGTQQDYDEWEQLGNSGWGYRDVFKYFKKLEKMMIPQYANDTVYHSTKGPVPISFNPFHTPLATAFLQAGRELGYPELDYNAERRIGVSLLQTTTEDGSRASANRAYLHAKIRKNLHVTKMSLVTKILIDERNKQAQGVRFTKGLKEYTVYARKEVIICGGAIASPQLLMLSGIGPAEHLEKFGIKVIKNLPVGDNLQDHIAYLGLTFTVDQPVSLLTKEIFRPGTPYVKDYMLYQDGPLSITAGSECLLLSDVDHPRNLTTSPTVEQFFLASSIGGHLSEVTTLGIKPEYILQMMPLMSKHSWTTLPIVLKPKSRGQIRLKSTNIEVHPEIVTNYLSESDDVKTMIRGIRQAINISKTTAMQRFKSEFFRLRIEKCDENEFDSDEYWECAVRHFANTGYHPCGSCKMGPENDLTAVVNPQLQVIGIKGLRVADASIMPTIPTAHTNIPTYMIAEKVSDMIKERWNYPIERLQ